MSRLNSQAVQHMWSFLLKAAPKSLQEQIEREWQKPYRDVFMFLSSRTKEQLRHMIPKGCPATEFLVLTLLKYAKEE